MSTIVVNNQYLFCYTNLFVTYPFDILGLIKKIELSKIESVDYCFYGNVLLNHQRLLITTKDGERLNIQCTNLDSLYELLNKRIELE